MTDSTEPVDGQGNLPEGLADLAREINIILRDEAAVSARFNEELAKESNEHRRRCEDILTRKSAETTDLRLEAGRLLIAAKAKVYPGVWRRWLRENIHRSTSDCYQLMKMAGSGDPEKEREKEKADTRSRVQKHRDAKRAKNAKVSVTPHVTDTPPVTPPITAPYVPPSPAWDGVAAKAPVKPPQEGTTIVNGEESVPLPLGTPQSQETPNTAPQPAPVIPEPLDPIKALQDLFGGLIQKDCIGFLEWAIAQLDGTTRTRFLEWNVMKMGPNTRLLFLRWITNLVNQAEQSPAAPVSPEPVRLPEVAQLELVSDVGLSPAAQDAIRKFQEHAKDRSPGPPWLCFGELEQMGINEDVVEELLSAKKIVCSPQSKTMVGIEPDWMKEERLSAVLPAISYNSQAVQSEQRLNENPTPQL